MKFLIILFSALILNSMAFAQTKKPAKKQNNTPVATESQWFSPDCTDCAALQTPGAANLGNTIGVLNTVPNKKTPAQPTTPEAEARSGQ